MKKITKTIKLGRPKKKRTYTRRQQPAVFGDHVGSDKKTFIDNAVEDTDLYQPEDVTYIREIIRRRYAKVISSIAKIQPNQAITVPIMDIQGLSPEGFATGARKIIAEHKDTAAMKVRTTVLKVEHRNKEKVSGVRFYRIS